jgi:hypothetical protein
VSAPPPDPNQRPEKSTRYGQLWTRGVPDVGHRDAALYKLARDGLYRRRTEARAVSQIQRWIRSGGIARSRAVLFEKKYHHEIADVSRRVHVVYTTHPHGRPDPANLTARELAQIQELAQRRAGVTAVPAAKIAELLWRALPQFKGCKLAGLPATRVHCREWERWAGSEYASVRAACGIFEPVTGYLSASRLRQLNRNPADAYARNWRAEFTFDEAAPRRPLGRTYPAAKLAAHFARAREDKRARHAKEPTAAPRRTDARSSSRNDFEFLPLNQHTQTAPSPAATAPPVEIVGGHTATGRDRDPCTDSAPAATSTGGPSAIRPSPPPPAPSEPPHAPEQILICLPGAHVRRLPSRSPTRSRDPDP